MNFNDKVILITGASTGIGKEMVKIIANGSLIRNGNPTFTVNYAEA